MILLDTNVISELSKPHPNPRVLGWLDAVEHEGTGTSAITVAELLTGLADLPDGQRKAALVQLTSELLQRLGRAPLPFDALAAEDYAAIVIARKKRGRPIGILDAQIAAIAVGQSMTLATMNTKDFEGIDGLGVVDPSQE
ncbi:MAG: type II toxin-antitoxin system VapC family toxin [Acidobacteriota bacterium]|nr:type II toxin-antitoxin system VapC family toxin [Acidobacteriota bacterium]